MATTPFSPPSSRSRAKLVRGSPRALYEQLADRLRDELLARHAAGRQLPTEDALTKAYAVSRVTVRRAMDMLVAEGALVRRQGKGTFVARPKPRIVHAIDRLAPFADTFKRAGREIDARLIEFAWVDDPELPESARDWELPVLSYTRAFSSDAMTHAVTREYLPRQIAEGVTRADVERMPTYDLLRKKLGITIASADFRVSSRPTSVQLAKILEVSPSTFLLVLERTFRDRDGRVIEAATHFLRPDVYQLSVRVNEFRQDGPHPRTPRKRRA